MGTFIPADDNQPQREVTPENGANFRREELYKLLSCSTIEILHLDDDRIMVCDEESKIEGKQRNERATKAANFVSPAQFVAFILQARDAGFEVIQGGDSITDMETDFVAGDVLICKDEEVQ